MENGLLLITVIVAAVCVSTTIHCCYVCHHSTDLPGMSGWILVISKMWRFRSRMVWITVMAPRMYFRNSHCLVCIPRAASRLLRLWRVLSRRAINLSLSAGTYKHHTNTHIIYIYICTCIFLYVHTKNTHIHVYIYIYVYIHTHICIASTPKRKVRFLLRTILPPSSGCL